MTASRVRADYDGLQEIARTFASQSEAVRQSYGALLQAKDILQSGDWVGKGADKFYEEMNTSVLASLKRLALALQSASETIKKISQIMKQAEQEAANVFKVVDEPFGRAAVMPEVGMAGGQAPAGWAPENSPGALSGAQPGGPGSAGTGELQGEPGEVHLDSREWLGFGNADPAALTSDPVDNGGPLDDGQGAGSEGGESQVEDGAIDNADDAGGESPIGEGVIDDDAFFNTVGDDAQLGDAGDTPAVSGGVEPGSLMDEGDVAGPEGGESQMEDFPVVTDDAYPDDSGPGMAAVAGGETYDGVGNRLVP